ncbi:MAG: Gfo/Idh/MocA family oxidoreductase [Chryseolinea sp.]
MPFIQGPVRWGIIGCGDVCEVKSGPAFGKIMQSSLVAVMRRDSAKAEDFATRHNVPRFYTSARELINDKEVNAVYIATPPESHEKYAIEVMQAGKPVYIEKPVTVDTSSCQRMIAASQHYNVPAVVAHYRRELPLFKKVKETIETGGIGDVLVVQLRLFQAPKNTNAKENWRLNPTVSGGGNFFDLAPHQLDILYWIFGPPQKTSGFSINQGKHYDAPDLTTLNAVFQKDIVFQGMWSFNAPENEQCDTCKIIGTNGTLEFPFFASFQKATLTTRRQEEKNNRMDEFVFPENIQQPMIQEVVSYFQGLRVNPCSLDEALVTLRMMEKANMSENKS